jgi:hypothetical protein
MNGLREFPVETAMHRVFIDYLGGYKGTMWYPHVRQHSKKNSQAAIRIESVLIRKPRFTFEEALQEYRKIEAELVEQAGDDEFDAIEIRRRIAEQIFTYGYYGEEPFEVCQKAWENLVALGFSSLDNKCNKVCVYADWALETGEYTAGLAIIEPMITEVEQFLAEVTIEPMWRKSYEETLVCLQRRREGLLAFQRSEAEGAEWMAREEARIEALEHTAPTPPPRCGHPTED